MSGSKTYVIKLVGTITTTYMDPVATATNSYSFVVNNGCLADQLTMLTSGPTPPADYIYYLNENTITSTFPYDTTDYPLADKPQTKTFEIAFDQSVDGCPVAWSLYVERTTLDNSSPTEELLWRGVTQALSTEYMDTSISDKIGLTITGETYDKSIPYDQQTAKNPTNGVITI